MVKPSGHPSFFISSIVVRPLIAEKKDNDQSLEGIFCVPREEGAGLWHPSGQARH